MSIDKQLTYDFSRSNPEAFKYASLQALGKYSVFGALIWNYATDRGAIDISKLTVDDTTWVSRSSAKGNITLGTQPMNESTKDRLLFHAERFSYPQEVAYRLLHEAVHSYLFLSQNSSAGENLLRATTNVRRATGGEQGLSALGSLDFYRGDDKIIEDATELITMYAWSPSYASEFTEFLASPDHAKTRNEVGLVSMATSKPLLGIIARAVEENISQ